jgi:S1-C subfamily serine protease
MLGIAFRRMLMAATDILSSLSNQLSSLVDGVAGIVSVQAGQGVAASGIHWRPGIIVTAEERLEQGEAILVTAPDGRQFAATLVGRDPSTDIAMLRIDGAGLPVVETGDAGGLRAGMLVASIGRHDGGPIAALGIVGFAGGAWRSARGGIIDGLLRLDLALDPAAEGGALVDIQGRVLGMTVFGPRRRALAIPASTIDRTVDLLLDKGHVARGYLGAGLQRVLLGKRPETAREHERGLLVVSLDPDGPAARAGLVIGDILTYWNGTPVSRVGEIMSALGPDSVATVVELLLLRAGGPIRLKLALGARAPA